MARRYNRRSRSPSPSDSDEDGGIQQHDHIHPMLYGQDGLHKDQRATRARLRNPGKYTDKSMRQAHSKRSQRRERTAAQPAVMGREEQIGGACVNSYGTIKNCEDLVTRVNFRPTYVNGEKLPLQMLYSMLLDEQPDVVHTYDQKLVVDYLGGVVARSLETEDDFEPVDWQNLQRFAIHTTNLLSQLHTMQGDVDPIQVLAERYLVPIFDENEAMDLINRSLSRRPDFTPKSIIKNLRNLVYRIAPPVKLWAFNKNLNKDHDLVLLRRGQIRSHPWEDVKRDVQRSFMRYQRNGVALRRRNNGNASDPGDDSDGSGGDGGGGRARGRNNNRQQRRERSVQRPQADETILQHQTLSYEGPSTSRGKRSKSRSQSPGSRIQSPKLSRESQKSHGKPLQSNESSKSPRRSMPILGSPVQSPVVSESGDKTPRRKHLSKKK